MPSSRCKGRVLLFGGTFDPIHVGHLILARHMMEKILADKVIFIPAAEPPHKTVRNITASNHRLRMVELAIEGQEDFEVSNVELTRSGPSYSYDTVKHFYDQAKQQQKYSDLWWMIGTDTLLELGTWHRTRDIMDMCTFAIARRHGCSEGMAFIDLAQVFDEDLIGLLREGIVEIPCIDISSTDIRKRMADGLSVKYMMPDKVLDYINEHFLYQGDT